MRPAIKLSESIGAQTWAAMPDPFRSKAAAVAACLVALAGAPVPAGAGAWLQDKGSGQIITSATVSRADRSFDADGSTEAAPDFAKEDYGIYAEYGLTSRLTAVFDARVTRLHPDPPASTVTGFGETQLGLRGRVWQKGPQLLSLQGTLLFPGDSVLTSGGLDAEIRALHGVSFTLGRMPGFLDSGLAYRKRAHGFRDELRPELTIGLYPAARWLLLAQSFNVVTIGSGRTNVFTGQQNKVQLSTVYRLTETVSVQLGGLATVAGTDVPEERALVTALWLSF